MINRITRKVHNNHSIICVVLIIILKYFFCDKTLNQKNWQATIIQILIKCYHLLEFNLYVALFRIVQKIKTHFIRNGFYSKLTAQSLY
jgi:hypothetical protein